MQRMDVVATLAAVLAMNPAGELQRRGEDVLGLGAYSDLALNAADDAAEIGSERAQRLVEVELIGMRITLMLDQRMLADPSLGLAQYDASSPGHPYRPFARPLHQPGVREHDVLGLHRSIN